MERRSNNNVIPCRKQRVLLLVCFFLLVIACSSIRGTLLVLPTTITTTTTLSSRKEAYETHNFVIHDTTEEVEIGRRRGRQQQQHNRNPDSSTATTGTIKSSTSDRKDTAENDPNRTTTTTASSSSSSHNDNDNSNDNSSNNDKEETLYFGSCLLVMDENARLPEWIAYHYYMLPLRHLVLLVDPRSETYPMSIVQAWRKFITIEVWSDRDIGLSPQQTTITTSHTKKNTTTIHHDTNRKHWVTLHHERQGQFYRTCTEYFQNNSQPPQHDSITNGNNNNNNNKNNKNTNKTRISWITCHDVDEYIYLDHEVIPDAPERMQQPGSVATLVQDLTRQIARAHATSPSLLQPATSRNILKISTRLGQTPQVSRSTETILSTTASTTTALTLTATANNNTHNQTATTSMTSLATTWTGKRSNVSSLPSRLLYQGSLALEAGCFMMLRTYFGTTEVSDQRVQFNVPLYLNGSDFETLKYLHRTSHSNAVNNGKGKSLVQVVAAVAAAGVYGTKHLAYVPGRQKIHQLVQGCSHVPSGIRIRHYLGSWEAYSSRPDGHRNHEMYQYRTQMGRDNPPDDSIRMWLTRFCQEMTKTLLRMQEVKRQQQQQQHQDREKGGENHKQRNPLDENDDKWIVQEIQALFQGTGKYPDLSPATREDNIPHLTPHQIKYEIERNYRDGVDNFAGWLKKHYQLTSLSNGTIVAQFQ